MYVLTNTAYIMVSELLGLIKYLNNRIEKQYFMYNMNIIIIAEVSVLEIMYFVYEYFIETYKF